MITFKALGIFNTVTIFSIISFFIIFSGCSQDRVGGYIVATKRNSGQFMVQMHDIDVKRQEYFLSLSNKTLSGQKNIFSHSLIKPRQAVLPIGTIFKKKVRGFESSYDDSLAELMKGKSLVHDFSWQFLVLSAGIMPETLKSMLYDSPKSTGNMKEALADPALENFSAHGILAIVADATYEVLPSEQARAITHQIQGAGSFEADDIYFIADRILRAKRVVYYISSKQIENFSLDKTMFDRAAKTQENVFNKGSYYSIMMEYQEPMVVAVGYSYFNVTRAGALRSRNSAPGPAEGMLVRTKRSTVPLLLH